MKRGKWSKDGEPEPLQLHVWFTCREELVTADLLGVAYAGNSGGTPRLSAMFGELQYRHS